jgi:hypothetical protein
MHYPEGALTMMALWIPLVPLYIMFRNMANKQGVIPKP